MFVIDLTPTYKKKVEVEIPNEANGGFEKSSFMAEFKRVNLEVSEEEKQEGALTLDELRALPQKQVLEHVLVGWSGLATKDKEEVLYSEKNRQALLRIPQAVDATARIFWNSIFKSEELKAKN